MKKYFLAYFFILSLLVFTGCGNNTDNNINGEKIFRYGTTAYGIEMGNTGLNPHSNYSGWSTVRYGVGETLFKFNDKGLNPHSNYSGWSTVRYGVGETLFKFNDKMELVPWLASGYERIDDYTVKIFLKDNIKFSSGRKLDGRSK